MAYRVIEWATGRVGTSAVLGIAGHDDLELVGAWVHNADKEGRDVGELCGIQPLGVLATRDTDALLALNADCVCYTATQEQGEKETVDELARILRAGKNVVNVTWPPLVYPQAIGGGVYEQLQDACIEGRSSLYTAGIDPGYGSLGMAIGALSVCQSVRTVRMYEIMNYATWVSPYDYMQSVYGFGQPDIENCLVLAPGYTSEMWGPTVSVVAAAMGVELDEVVEAQEVIYADDDFDIASGHIAKGTIAGMRFEIRGMLDGEPCVVVDHVTKLRDDDFPEVQFEGGGYRIQIDGEPCLRVDMDLSSHHGDRVHAAYVATAMAAVNAIPAVCDAPPGVLSYPDLPPHAAKNLVRGEV